MRVRRFYEIVGAIVALLTAASIIIGGIMWLAEVESKATAASTGVADVRSAQAKFQESQTSHNQEVIGRLSRIEQGVEILLDDRKKKQ